MSGYAESVMAYISLTPEDASRQDMYTLRKQNVLDEAMEFDEIIHKKIYLLFVTYQTCISN